MKRTILFAIIAGWFCVAAAHAQGFTPPQNSNAALRYWSAFAEMKDRVIDDATTRRIEDVLNGRADWDEPSLGPIVEENADAVRAMQRGTELPDCNWGLDYSLGPALPLAHLPKARVLARLNALYGVRQMSQGDSEAAVTTWLEGLRFAQHVGKGISLIGMLSAKPAFLANLHLLTQAVQSGRVNSELQDKIKLQLRRLPAEGLDWIDPIQTEAWADAESLKYLAQSKNFQETYEEFFREPPPQPAHPPTAGDLSAFHSYMDEVIAAFHKPPSETRERLTSISTRTKSTNPAVQSIIPNYQKLNDTRQEVSSALQALTKVLGQRP
jgi:hypothetical protein